MGKVFSKEELIAIGDLCEKHNIIIISDEVYDRLYYTPFTRIATLSSALAARTLTVGSAGKNFYCTGWRVGWLLGPEYLVKYVATAHTRICFCGVSPLQEAAAVAFEKAEEEDFWNRSREDMHSKIQRFGAGLTELGIPVSPRSPVLSTDHIRNLIHPALIHGQKCEADDLLKKTVHYPLRRLLHPRQLPPLAPPSRLRFPAACAVPAPRLQGRLVRHHGDGCRGHPAHGILYQGQRPHGGGLSSLRSLSDG